MRKKQRLLSGVLIVVMVLCLTACGDKPTPTATNTPTNTPTAEPTKSPSATPTNTPEVTPEPTKTPTAEPTKAPTSTPVPTNTPTAEPTKEPTKAPTAEPTKAPTAEPTKAPTATPLPTSTPAPTATPVPVALTTPVITVNSEETGLTWTTVEHAVKMQLKVNDGAYADATEYAFPATAGSYTVKVKAIGDGKAYLDSEEAVFTFTVANSSITVDKTATATAKLQFAGKSLKVKNGENYIAIPDGVPFDSATKTYTYSSSIGCRIELKAEKGWNDTEKVYYPEDTFKGVTLVPFATSDFVLEDASSNNTNELLTAAWPDTKYSGDKWVDSNATVTAARSYKTEFGKAMQLNCWTNGTAFAYTTSYSVSEGYKAIEFDIRGDGLSDVTIQITNKTSHVFAKNNIGKIDKNTWVHVVIPMDNANWQLAYDGTHTFTETDILKRMGYVDSAEALSAFDEFAFIFKGQDANYSNTVLCIDNVKFTTNGTGNVTKEPLQYVVSFEDGTTGNTYNKSGWTEYSYGWVNETGTMNCREKGGSKVVNMKAGNDGARQYTFGGGSMNFGNFDTIDVKIGNYYNSGTTPIQVKVGLVRGDKSVKYIIGDSSNFVTVPSTSDAMVLASTLLGHEIKFDAMNVYGIVFTLKASADTWFYVDDITLTNSTNPEVVQKLDFEDGTAGIAYADTTMSSMWKRQVYKMGDKTGSNLSMNCRNEQNNGASLSNKVVNFVSTSSYKRFTYSTGNVLGSFNHLSLWVGNYYSGTTDIQFKVSVLDENSAETWVIGDASNYVTVAPGTGMNIYDGEFARKNVKAIRVYVKSASDNKYLYIDDLALDNVPETLGTPSVSVKADGTGLEWAAVTGASGYKVKVNGGEYFDAADYTFPTEAGDYTVKVKAIGDGINYKDGGEAVFTFAAVESGSITTAKTSEDTVTFTFTGLGCKYSNDGKNFSDVGMALYNSEAGKYIITAAQLGDGTQTLTLKVPAGFDSTAKKLYIADKTVEVKLFVTASSPLVIEDVSVNNTDALLKAAWDIKKFASTSWETTSATITAGNSYAGSFGKAMQLNFWNNDTAFKFAKTYNTDLLFDAISVDVFGDGIANVKLQLSDSKSGVYATINLGTIPANQWLAVTIPMSASGWQLTYGTSNYSFAQALPVMGLYSTEELFQYFDTVSIVLNGHTTSGSTSVILADNLKFVPEFSGSTVTTTPINAHFLTFEDGKVGSTYQNSRWTVRQYKEDWFAETGKMNSRSKNGSRVVNMYADSTSRKYTFATGSKIGNYDGFSLDLANTYAAGAISVKIGFITDQSGTLFTPSLPGADANGFLSVPNTSTLGAATDGMVSALDLINAGIVQAGGTPLTGLNFTARDIYGIVFTVKASATTYLYIDNLTLTSSTAASPAQTLDFEDVQTDTGYSGTALSNLWTCQAYKYDWKPMTSLDMNVRNEMRNGNSVTVSNNKVVNLVATSAKEYTYALADNAKIGTYNRLVLSLGNYFTGAGNISYKIAVVDGSGSKTYLVGSSSEYATFAPTTELVRKEYSFTTQDVYKIMIWVKNPDSSTSARYLYVDDISLYTE